jgi:RNA polymerase sigma-70 factor (ECF subfamily)
LEEGVHFPLCTGDKDKMHTADANLRNELSLGVRISKNGTREMQDVLSRYLPSFYRRAYRYLGNAADAEDAVQDALLSAYKHLDQFKGEAQMSTWLTAIVTNSARMHLRRRPRQIHVSLDEKLTEEQEYPVSERLADGRPSPEDECRKSELGRSLKQFVEQLSPPLRKAFQLRALDGLSTSEAARILGVPEGTVKAQLARARARLRRFMRRRLNAQHGLALTRTGLQEA